MKLLFFLFITSFFSCKVVNNDIKNSKNVDDTFKISNRITLHEGEWISNFKNEVFIRSLKRNTDTTFSMYLDSVDASTSVNLDWLNYDKKLIFSIDSLVSIVTRRKEFNWKIENRKVIFNVCLEYRLSKELDSIAFRFYEIYKN